MDGRRTTGEDADRVRDVESASPDEPPIGGDVSSAAPVPVPGSADVASPEVSRPDAPSEDEEPSSMAASEHAQH